MYSTCLAASAHLHFVSIGINDVCVAVCFRHSLLLFAVLLLTVDCSSHYSHKLFLPRNAAESSTQHRRLLHILNCISLCFLFLSRLCCISLALLRFYRIPAAPSTDYYLLFSFTQNKAIARNKDWLAPLQGPCFLGRFFSQYTSLFILSLVSSFFSCFLCCLFYCLVSCLVSQTTNHSNDQQIRYDAVHSLTPCCCSCRLLLVRSLLPL